MADPEPDHLFEPDADRWVPAPITAGPWSPDALHGGPAAALVGRLLVDHEAEAGEWFLSRLTCELVCPVPLAPLRVGIVNRRPGRRVQVLDAVVTDPAGTEVMWARGLRTAVRDIGLDEASLTVPAEPALPAPRELPSWRLRLDLPWSSFGQAIEFRRVVGVPFTELGPAVIWMRLLVPVLAGQPVHPLDRVLCSADFANGVANVVSFERFTYINPDLTVSLHRLPVGEWLLLDADTQMSNEGRGVARATVRDGSGAVGTAIQSLVVTPR